MLMAETKGWYEKYAKVKSELPEDGYLLTAEGGAGVRLNIVALDGERPSFKATAYVTSAYGVEPKWVARGEKDASWAGLKCIVMRNSAFKALAALGASLEGKSFVVVEALRVVKKSSGGSALMCEIVDPRIGR